MDEDPTIRLAQLRLLADAAIAALSDPDLELSGLDRIGDGPVPEDAAEVMLRALLEHALPVLRATRHHTLIAHIEAALADRVH